ncbi:hypothetical protein HAX54_046024, partial [Datura stramonium]|nr:hypothetical protein [Datura stramonium]
PGYGMEEKDNENDKKERILYYFSSFAGKDEGSVIGILVCFCEREGCGRDMGEIYGWLLLLRSKRGKRRERSTIYVISYVA